MVAPKNPEGGENASIVAGYAFTPNGGLVVYLKNNTDKIMIVDKTMSFFINTDGSTTSFFDPTVRTSTVTDISSTTKGASLNMGAVAGALGVGGPLGTLLNGVNVGGAGTSGQSVSNTTYIADQPRISLGPHGGASLPNNFMVRGLGSELSVINGPVKYITEDPNKSGTRFSVCISYSFDDGETFEKMTTDFYINTQIAEPVHTGRNLNDALQAIYKTKNDAIFEPWWVLKAWSNVNTEFYWNNAGFADYQ